MTSEAMRDSSAGHASDTAEFRANHHRLSAGAGDLDCEEFVKAVKATGRMKLIMTALWTEACLTFPTLDALREGFEVYPIVDAVGGTSLEAHRAGLDRVVQAGARAASWVQLACELQRDWARTKTVPEFANILFAVEGH